MFNRPSDGGLSAIIIFRTEENGENIMARTTWCFAAVLQCEVGTWDSTNKKGEKEKKKRKKRKRKGKPTGKRKAKLIHGAPLAPTCPFFSLQSILANPQCSAMYCQFFRRYYSGGCLLRTGRPGPTQDSNRPISTLAAGTRGFRHHRHGVGVDEQDRHFPLLQEQRTETCESGPVTLQLRNPMNECTDMDCQVALKLPVGSFGLPTYAL